MKVELEDTLMSMGGTPQEREPSFNTVLLIDINEYLSSSRSKYREDKISVSTLNSISAVQKEHFFKRLFVKGAGSIKMSKDNVIEDLLTSIGIKKKDW